MSRYSLAISHPDLGERSFPLEVGGTYHIGSRPDNDVIIATKDVSRRHAVLKVMDGVFQITDLKSKNGTFVAGRRVDTSDIRCGDEVRLSSALLVVLEESDPRRSTGSFRPPQDTDVVEEPEETERHFPVLAGEDLVDLLMRVKTGLASRSLSPPLEWAVSRPWVEGAMVLYGTGDGISLVASAGDLGGLLSDSGALRSLVARSPSQGLVQLAEHGQQLVLARLAAGNVLVVRHLEHAPDGSELGAVVAAIDILLEAAAAIGQAQGGART